MVRTRTAAAALADTGKVRVNGARIDASSKTVRPGDVVTVTLDRVRVLKVLDFCERRGMPTQDGRSTRISRRPFIFRKLKMRSRRREPGAGRPTKRERRALDRLRSDHDI